MTITDAAVAEPGCNRPRLMAGKQWGAPAKRLGGAEGDRTPDLRIANATLSQLSYGPNSQGKGSLLVP